jgi:hypothetical protein
MTLAVFSSGFKVVLLVHTVLGGMAETRLKLEAVRPSKKSCKSDRTRLN